MFNQNLCVICEDTITDPICISCYIKQTMISLNDLKVNPLISNFINKKLKNLTSQENLNDTRCILCKRDTVSICRYCFSENIIRILRELNFSEDLVENFCDNSIYEEIEMEMR